MPAVKVIAWDLSKFTRIYSFEISSEASGQIKAKFYVVPTVERKLIWVVVVTWSR